MGAPQSKLDKLHAAFVAELQEQLKGTTDADGNRTPPNCGCPRRHWSDPLPVRDQGHERQPRHVWPPRCLQRYVSLRHHRSAAQALLRPAMYDHTLNRWPTAYHRGYLLDFEGDEAGPITALIHVMRSPDFPLIRGSVAHASYGDAVAAGVTALDELLDRH
jgi:hypothetical protein